MLFFFFCLASPAPLGAGGGGGGGAAPYGTPLDSPLPRLRPRLFDPSLFRRIGGGGGGGDGGAGAALSTSPATRAPGGSGSRGGGGGGGGGIGPLTDDFRRRERLLLRFPSKPVLVRRWECFFLLSLQSTIDFARTREARDALETTEFSDRN